MVAGLGSDHSGGMTTIPPEAPPTDGPFPGDQSGASGPRVSGAQMRDVSRLRRTVGADRRVAGVAGGIARHFDIDPVLVRVAFVVLALFGGGGLLLYLALWLVLPDESGGAPTLQLDPRSLTFAIIGVGVLAVLILLGQTWSGYSAFPWPLAVIGLVVLLVVLNRRQHHDPASAGPAPAQPLAGQQWPPPTGTAAYAAPAAYAPTATPPSPAYGTPYAGAQQSPPSYGYTPPPSPPAWTPTPNPRKRGPILFWFTAALITLALGILGMVDVAGHDIPGSAYAALAAGIIGVMLVVASVYGRGGGLIFLGLMSVVVLAGTSLAEHYASDPRVERPVSSTELNSRYFRGAGELVVDLTAISDPSALSGRTVRIEGGAGRIEVIVPDDWDVRADATLDGPGTISLFGSSEDGIDLTKTNLHNVSDEVTDLTISAELGVGEIDIHTEEQS